MRELQTQNKDQFFINFKSLVSSERKLTAEVLEYVKEADRRKLYLDFGYTSLFAFLTKELGYAAASAQRRIEAARLLKELPEIKSDLESGELNLTQVSLVAQNIKAAQKLGRGKIDAAKEEDIYSSAEKKLELLNAVKGQDVKSSQKILAQKLDIPVQTFERTRIQQDESIRAEIFLTKAQMQLLERVKELISHTDPNPKLSEVFEKLAQFYIEKKDPAQPKITRHNFRSEVTEQQTGRRPIATAVKREIFQRDQVCQWKEVGSENICGSKFRLQLDHIYSVSKGGQNETRNLQLLCAVHNQRKFQLMG